MPSPKSTTRSRPPSDAALRALLDRLHCPTPLHVLRMRMLGQMASPEIQVAPMALLADAWGGELPEFGSSAELEQFSDLFLNRLWNRLADHQNARDPFRLPRTDVPPTRQALHDLARRRAQELEGFVDGLFGSEEEMQLPQKAHDAISALSEVRAIFDGAATMLADETKVASASELKSLLHNLQRLTLAADEQLNKVIQSCKRARGQAIAAMVPVPTQRPGSAANHDESVDDEDVDDDELDDEPGDAYDVMRSPLCQTLTRNSVRVDVQIYDDGEGRWILELVDAEGTSHVWDDHFDTDQLAWNEALRAIDEDPGEFRGGQSVH